MVRIRPSPFLIARIVIAQGRLVRVFPLAPGHAQDLFGPLPAKLRLQSVRLVSILAGWVLVGLGHEMSPSTILIRPFGGSSNSQRILKNTRKEAGSSSELAPTSRRLTREYPSTAIPTVSRPAVSGSTKPSSMCNKHTCGDFADPSLHPRRIRNLVPKPSSDSLPGSSRWGSPCGARKACPGS